MKQRKMKNNRALQKYQSPSQLSAQQLLRKQFTAGMQAVKEASKVALQYYKKLPQIQRKASGSVVTLADIAAENVMFSIIEAKFPFDSLHGEETGLQKKKTNYTWIADPIDGTSNYMHGLPMFAVSLALLENKEPILAFVVLPFYQETFYAIKGKGAYLLRNKKKYLLHVSQAREFKDSLLLLSIKQRSDHKVIEQCIKAFAPYCNYRVFGSVVFNIMQLAKGNVQAVISHNLNQWDNAAALLIAEEAGAMITDYQGNAWKLSQNNFLITNKILHEHYLAIVKRIGL